MTHVLLCWNNNSEGFEWNGNVFFTNGKAADMTREMGFIKSLPRMHLSHTLSHEYIIIIS